MHGLSARSLVAALSLALAACPDDNPMATEGSDGSDGSDGSVGTSGSGDSASGTTMADSDGSDSATASSESGPPPVMCTEYVPGQCDPICFEDPVLEALVRERLQIGPDEVITPAMAATLTGIISDETVEVSSLGGLECFEGIVTLGLNDDTFTDLSPVADLPVLEDLIIRRTPVASVPALASPVLIQLWLIETEVSDLSALEGSVMQELLVSGSPVEDLEVVESMSSLWRLEAEDTQVADLGPVAAAPSLFHVILNNAAITDAAPMMGNTTIEQLWLEDNGISDLTPLAQMPNIEWLHVSGNPVDDLSPLMDAPQLTWLGMSDTQVTDLTPLLSTSIESIELDRVPLADPQQLWTLTGLRTVSAEEIGLTSLMDVPAPMEWLLVGGNEIVDVAPIDGLVELTDLDLHDNQVIDLAPIATAPVFDQSCRIFDITGNPLDAHSTDTVIPALCDQQIIVQADVNACLQKKACGPID